ncbi:UNVERIFIED_CONTAM: hypothetical protein HDU68_002793 [Siphonaria sp. JEL0065]|nr:hypothetical protein HDU68_002793 [Siphonaria sp. JEL0065]
MATMSASVPLPIPATHKAHPRGALGHMTLGVSDLARSTVFYDAVMATVGLTRVCDSFPDCSGYGLEHEGSQSELIALRPLDEEQGDFKSKIQFKDSPNSISP